LEGSGGTHYTLHIIFFMLYRKTFRLESNLTHNSNSNSIAVSIAIVTRIYLYTALLVAFHGAAVFRSDSASDSVLVLVRASGIENSSSSSSSVENKRTATGTGIETEPEAEIKTETKTETDLEKIIAAALDEIEMNSNMNSNMNTNSNNMLNSMTGNAYRNYRNYDNVRPSLLETARRACELTSQKWSELGSTSYNHYQDPHGQDPHGQDPHHQDPHHQDGEQGDGEQVQAVQANEQLDSKDRYYNRRSRSRYRRMDSGNSNKSGNSKASSGNNSYSNNNSDDYSNANSNASSASQTRPGTATANRPGTQNRPRPRSRANMNSTERSHFGQDNIEIFTDNILAVLLIRIIAILQSRSPTDLTPDLPQFHDFSTSTICNTILVDEARRVSDEVYKVEMEALDWPEIITQEIVLQLRTYIWNTLSLYRGVFYHNCEHAHHVFLSANKLLDLLLVEHDWVSLKDKGKSKDDKGKDDKGKQDHKDDHKDDHKHGKSKRTSTNSSERTNQNQNNNNNHNNNDLHHLHRQDDGGDSDASKEDFPQSQSQNQGQQSCPVQVVDKDSQDDTTSTTTTTTTTTSSERKNIEYYISNNDTHNLAYMIPTPKKQRPTYGIKRDTLTHLGFLFSALVHDVDHKGVSNRQLVLEADELAIMYNDQSVAEQRSLAVAFTLLMKEDFRELRNVLFVNRQEFLHFRSNVIDLVLCTDISSPERVQIVKSKWKEAFGDKKEKKDKKKKELKEQKEKQQQQKKQQKKQEHQLQSLQEHQLQRNSHDIGNKNKNNNNDNSDNGNGNGSVGNKNSNSAAVTTSNGSGNTVDAGTDAATNLSNNNNNKSCDSIADMNDDDDDDDADTVDVDDADDHDDVDDADTNQTDTEELRRKEQKEEAKQRKKERNAWKSKPANPALAHPKHSNSLVRKFFSARGSMSMTNANMMNSNDFTSQMDMNMNINTNNNNNQNDSDCYKYRKNYRNNNNNSNDDDDDKSLSLHASFSDNDISSSSERSESTIYSTCMESEGEMDTYCSSSARHQRRRRGLAHRGSTGHDRRNSKQQRGGGEGEDGREQNSGSGSTFHHPRARRRFTEPHSVLQSRRKRFHFRLGIRRALDLTGTTIEAYDTNKHTNLGRGTVSDPDRPNALKAIVVLEQMLKAADIAANMQKWETMLKWSGNLFQELKTCFVQGRGDDPAQAWHENQIAFFESYALPLASCLADTKVLEEEDVRQLTRNVQENNVRWMIEGRNVVQKLVQKWDARQPRRRSSAPSIYTLNFKINRLNLDNDDH